MDRGLVLVWDLDQTLVGWSPMEMKFRLNTRAMTILKEAFIAKSSGIVKTIMVLTNNSDPDEAIDAIEEEVGSKFDYIIARNDPLRNKTNSTVKDLATVSRVLGYDVEPDNIWLIDDMRHKMVDEGAHWIQIAKQENNPFGSGFSEDPDMTDYSALQTILTAYRRRGGGRTRLASRKQKKRRRSKNRKSAAKHIK